MENHQIFPFDILYEIGIHLDLNHVANLTRTNRENSKLFALLIPHYKIIISEISEECPSEITNKITQLIRVGANYPVIWRHFNDLKRVSFDNIFNQSIAHLPDKITHLTLGDKFNFPIYHLPLSLTHLKFGHKFNQSIDDLPKKLTHLTLGYKFNLSIDKLPNELTHLTLGHSFDQSIDNLPKSLTHLTLGHKFKHSIDNLPNGLLRDWVVKIKKF